MGTFDGFPKTTQFVQTKFEEIPLLHYFKTVEQCSLEYDPVRGASIDPHIDDCWIWGERIVTVNVLGDSVLTMTPYRGPTNRYNLDCVPKYNSSILRNDSTQSADIDDNIVVRLPMPARSLMILYGPARYDVLLINVRTRNMYRINTKHDLLSLDINGSIQCFDKTLCRDAFASRIVN